MGFAKLYTAKQPITAADILNDWVLPLFESYSLSVLLILAGRGTEYHGRQDIHDHQLFSAINGIGQTRTKAKKPAN